MLFLFFGDFFLLFSLGFNYRLTTYISHSMTIIMITMCVYELDRKFTRKIETCASILW